MKNKGKYKISVIVPIYNGSKYLVETLEVLLLAGKDLVQIILIDDGSDDGSDIICLAYQKKSDNVLYYRKENGGIVSARNKGLELAEGEYICFCDQDDLVESDFYQVMYDAVSSDNCDICICGTNRYINGNKVVCEQFKEKIYEKDQIMTELLCPVLFYGSDLGKAPNERWVGTIWKCIIKRELIERNNLQFRKHINYEDDLIFYTSVLVNARKGKTIPYLGYNWRINLRSETYNWKYIENLPIKYRTFIDDMIEMISLTDCKEYIVENYYNYQVCTMCEELVLNEGSIQNKKSFKDKILYIKRNMENKEIKEALSFRNHIWKSSIRKKVTLVLLAHKLWIAAYLWCVNYKKFREKAIGNKIWFELERKIKNRMSRNVLKKDMS